MLILLINKDKRRLGTVCASFGWVMKDYENILIGCGENLDWKVNLDN
jgi:hypothetical protein